MPSPALDELCQLARTHQSQSPFDPALLKQLVGDNCWHQWLSRDDLSPLLDVVIAIALTPSLPAPHSALACETLSAWLSRSSSSAQLRKPLQGDRIDQCFSIVVCHFGRAPTAFAKALKGLLRDTIVLCQQLGQAAKLEAWAAKALHDMDTGDRRKAAFYLLEVLAKRGVGAARVFAEYRRMRPDGSADGEQLVHDMLCYLEDRDLCPVIGKALVALLEARRQEMVKEGVAEKEWLSVWATPMKKSLADDDLRWKIQTYVLPELFRWSPGCFEKLLHQLGLRQDAGAASEESPEDAEGMLGALLCCLKVGKDVGLVGEVDEQESAASSKIRIRLSSAMVSPLLAHAQHHIRLSALTLVSQSPATTSLVPPAAFTLLNESLPLLHAETDAEVRDNVVVNIRSLIQRLAASSYAAENVLKAKHKTANSISPEDVAKREALEQGIRDTLAFIKWYLSFLLTLLHPGASYQLVSTGLRVLALLVRSGVDASVAPKAYESGIGEGSFVNGNGEQVRKGLFKWPEFSSEVCIFTRDMKNALLDLLFNPYDDIRALARGLLGFSPSWDAAGFAGFLERGFGAMNDAGRARDADGVARTLELWFEISPSLSFNRPVLGIIVPDGAFGVLQWVMDVIEREYLGVAEANFHRAVKERPVHGLFAGLRLVLERSNVYAQGKAAEWRELHRRVFGACTRVWELSKSTLCIDSPEGYMPVDMEDEEDEDMDTQTVMSYSWRAVKESSALLGTVVKCAPYAESPEQSTLSLDDLKATGDLLIAQLANIRHRGAFFSVAPSFLTLCSRCFRLPADAQSLPPTWLSQNLALILSKSNKITRRSAGLPYLIVGVLASETDPARPLLASTFERLVEIATLPTLSNKVGAKMDLPQVHALNCIKFLFTDSRLSAAVQLFAGAGLELAVSCFRSGVWAIRNCGVMLFTALMNRLFGVRRSRNEYAYTANMFSTQSFFRKYPTTRDVLLENLRENVSGLQRNEATSVEMVYPGLSLIARLDVVDAYEGMAEFEPLIKTCLQSRVWKVRVMAAQAQATLISAAECVGAIEGLLDTGLERQNVLHGRLYAVGILLERRVEQAVMVDGEATWLRIFEAFAAHFNTLVRWNHCAITKALYLQLLTKHALSRLLSIEKDTCPALLEYVLDYCPSAAAITREITRASIVGRTLLKDALAQFTLTKIVSSVSSRAALLEFISLLHSPDEELALFTAKHLLAATAKSTALHLPPQAAQSLNAVLWKLVAAADTWDQLRVLTLQLLSWLAQTYPAVLDAEDLAARWNVVATFLTERQTEPLREAALTALGHVTARQWLRSSCNDDDHGGSGDGSRGRSSCISVLLGHITDAAGELKPFSTRLAATTALTALAPVLPLPREPVIAHSDEVDTLLVPAYTVLYDLLNDDDVDIRTLAARLFRRISASPSSSSHQQHLLHPFAASAALAAALPRAFPVSAELRRRAVERLTNAITAKAAFEAATRHDAALFVEERQNLYQDRAREVETWARVVRALLLFKKDDDDNEGGVNGDEGRLDEWARESIHLAHEWEARGKTQGRETNGPHGLRSGEEAWLWWWRVRWAAWACGAGEEPAVAVSSS